MEHFTIPSPMGMLLYDLLTAAGQWEQFQRGHFHLTITNEAWMPLDIQADPHPDPGIARRLISVAHYFNQNGEAIADPEARMNQDGFPITLRQWVGIIDDTDVLWRDQASGKVMLDPDAKAAVEELLALWARNLRTQGFVEAARDPANVSR